MAINKVLITFGLKLLFDIIKKFFDAEVNEKDGSIKHGIVRDFINKTKFGVKDTDGFIHDVVALFKKHEIFIKGEG